LKIVHAADFHLGARRSGFGRASAALGRARWDALTRTLDLARERKADLVVIAGDLFDRESPARDVARRAFDVVTASSAPVAIIPGNHDCFTERSVWTRAPWDALPENVLVLTRPEEVVRPFGLDLVLYPCPLAAKEGSESPVSWIGEAHERRAKDASFHVGLAHGSLTIIPHMDEYCFPIDPGETDSLGLDYLALGHWHSRTSPDEAERQRWAYAGVPEPLKSGDPEGAALVVELGRGSVSVEAASTGEFTFKSAEREIMEAQDVSGLAGELKRLPRREKTVLSVRLAGLAPLAAFEEATRLEAALEEEGFVFVRVDASVLRPEPQDIELARLPQGPVRRALEIMIEGEKAAEGEAKDVAARALALAWQLFGQQG
jgi:DNA repair exonuclease SbcCD nuclease subunit